MTQRKDPNRYPKGWNRARVQALLDHYENQTDDEAVAEDDAAIRRRPPKPAKPRRRGTVGYRRDTADGATTLVPAAGLPVGRLPAARNRTGPKQPRPSK
jgi:hypothetical protein